MEAYMQAAVLDPVRTEPASFPLDLPSTADLFYPDFGSALSPVPANSNDATAPAFTVDSLAKADWAISRILDAEARIARRAELASTLHERIDQWLTKASAADEDSITYLSLLLRPWVEAELSTQRRSRSISLPSGIAQLRKLPDRLDITDPEAAMAWAIEHRPEAIIVKKELSKSVLKTLVFKEGEAVPGIEAELGPDSLFIKPNV
jgi:phage host-nuclease inhibitor protein Gam